MSLKRETLAQTRISSTPVSEQELRDGLLPTNAKLFEASRPVLKRLNLARRGVLVYPDISQVEPKDDGNGDDADDAPDAGEARVPSVNDAEEIEHQKTVLYAELRRQNAVYAQDLARRSVVQSLARQAMQFFMRHIHEVYLHSEDNRPWTLRAKPTGKSQAWDKATISAGQFIEKLYATFVQIPMDVIVPEMALVLPLAAAVMRSKPDVVQEIEQLFPPIYATVIRLWSERRKSPPCNCPRDNPGRPYFQLLATIDFMQQVQAACDRTRTKADAEGLSGQCAKWALDLGTLEVLPPILIAQVQDLMHRAHYVHPDYIDLLPTFPDPGQLLKQMGIRESEEATKNKDAVAAAATAAVQKANEEILQAIK
jgi:hypothetical protein